MSPKGDPKPAPFHQSLVLHFPNTRLALLHPYGLGCPHKRGDYPSLIGTSNPKHPHV